MSVLSLSSFLYEHEFIYEDGIYLVICMLGHKHFQERTLLNTIVIINLKFMQETTLSRACSTCHNREKFYEV